MPKNPSLLVQCVECTYNEDIELEPDSTIDGILNYFSINHGTQSPECNLRWDFTARLYLESPHA